MQREDLSPDTPHLRYFVPISRMMAFFSRLLENPNIFPSFRDMIYVFDWLKELASVSYRKFFFEKNEGQDIENSTR
jgi:hypothetical protein